MPDRYLSNREHKTVMFGLNYYDIINEAQFKGILFALFKFACVVVIRVKHLQNQYGK